MIIEPNADIILVNIYCGQEFLEKLGCWWCLV